MQSSHQDTPEQPAITGHIPTPDPDLYSDLGVVIPLATVAALDSSAWSGLNPTSAIPVNWEDRARRAWEFYVEEPLVKNCVNSWRTFAVGDEIQITADDEQVRNEAAGLAGRLDICKFVKDMLDEKQVKPIVEMLMAGIIGVETAQEMFGLDSKQNPSHGTRAEAAWMGLFTQADFKDDICDSCGFFDEELNKCGVTEAETTFDTRACRFLRPKSGSKPGI